MGGEKLVSNLYPVAKLSFHERQFFPLLAQLGNCSLIMLSCDLSHSFMLVFDGKLAVVLIFLILREGNREQLIVGVISEKYDN
jgi:hypothetical protein